jgi:hypothetical protein
MGYLHLLSTFLLISLFQVGCKQSSNSNVTEQSNEKNLVLSQERKIPAGAIWDREFNGSRPGTLSISVDGASSFTVTLVEDSVYQSMVNNNKSIDDFSAGMYINSESDSKSFTTSCKLDRGKYWISITNRSNQESLFTLKCHSW